MRRVKAWRKVTSVSRDKRGHAPYFKLKGEAFNDAEFLNQKLLKGNGGVKALMRWVQTDYMDAEISEVGAKLTVFFRKLRRGPSQDIQEFNRSYTRGVQELREIGIELPDLVTA